MLPNPNHDYGWSPRAWAAILISTTAAVFGLGIAVQAIRLRDAPFVWIALATYLGVTLAVCFHELAHAAMCWLLNARVVTIAIGVLPFRRTFAADNFQIVVSPSLGGWVHYVLRGERCWRLRTTLIALAGPFANLVFGTSCAMSVWQARVPLSTMSWVAIIFALVNAGALATSMRPGTIGRSGRATDISCAVQVWRLSDSQVSARVRVAEAVEELFRSKKVREHQGLSAAIDHLVATIDQYPDQPLLSAQLFELTWEGGQRRRSIEALRDSLASWSHDDPSLAESANSRAWQVVMDEHRTPAELEAAEEISRMVVDWTDRPRVRWRGTLGAILIDRGKLDEGLEHLEWAFSTNRYLPHRALDACYLAIAEIARGDPETAAHYYRRARRFDPQCPLLARARARLSGA